VDCSVSAESALQREPVSQPEEERRAWPRVSRLVWELDDSLLVAAMPVSLVADARQARALRAPVQSWAQAQPVELGGRRVQERELAPVAHDSAVERGCSTERWLDEHWRRPDAAELRREQELRRRWVCLPR
jgi:hypothetical protein